MSSISLETQIQDARRKIATDGYPMSIGELTNIYRDHELLIRPEFQRLYRWTTLQKSRLIESILLGIPLPSIFVAQSEKGMWELVDGLQRVSTILELQGELRDRTDDQMPELILEATPYLSELAGRTWSRKGGPKPFTDAQRLDVKRSKIDIKIIKRDSSPETKFDLFQRLNSYGSSLTPQELRSALLVATSPEFLAWAEGLATFPAFVECTCLSERLIQERFDLELVLKFLIMHDRPTSHLTVSSLRDFSGILDNEAISLAKQHPLNSGRLESVFKTSFELLVKNGGEDVFRRWDSIRMDFRGPFLHTAFEVFALGLGFHVSGGTAYRSDILNAVKEFWSRPDMQSGFATGRSTEARLSQFVPFGRCFLSQGD